VISLDRFQSQTSMANVSTVSWILCLTHYSIEEEAILQGGHGIRLILTGRGGSHVVEHSGFHRSQSSRNCRNE